MDADRLPIWIVLLLTIGLVLLAIEVGARLGQWRTLRAGAKLDVSGAMVGAAMSLLSFMLAFTFNGAAGRHDARKNLVVAEANALDQTWLRAAFLDEPYREDLRGLLRQYADLRVKVAEAAGSDIPAALRESNALQEKMWAVALEAGQKDPHSITIGLLVQALNESIDEQTKRVTVGLRNRVPSTVWAVLGLIMAIGTGMIGAQLSLAGARRRSMELALAVSFSLVVALILDLDRPQQGLIEVSQQAMIDVQTRMHSE
jgi:hypothetical protein